ncbi:Rap1-interacting factor 1 N terminal-domain-containing protein [Aspergillus unguis]
MVDVLAPLSARPPTPPRTASHMLSEKDRTEESPVPVQTPNESPFVKAESIGASSSRQSKRVNFSPWPNFIKAPSFTNTKSKTLPPSNDRKPTRSILKTTHSPGPITSPARVVSYTPETFAMLLESVTRQLAGETISSRTDAYMQLFNALRAYEKLPTEEEIVRKLGLITQFIQRDIGRDLTGPTDTNLAIQALKLSVVLVWHPQISPELPDDFKLFLVEHSVSCLEDGKLPKSVMNHYLTVLSTQKFSTKIITSARAIRILEMLNALTDRVKGNSVVSQRLMIYERLFEVSKSTFIAHSSLWMDHLISGLLHQIKNVRLSALDLGFNAYMASGANSTLSKTVRDIFDRTLANNRKLVCEIGERMSRMMANPDTGEHVPQIWGVITLLLRNKRFNIYQWQHFKEWVLVLQKCFNCSDSEIKSKAISNWNRFVLVANINETTNRSLLRMLSKPLLSQFERKKHDKSGSQPSQLVVASYYNLLYYAFRPDASHQQFDSVWEEYIAVPSSKIFSSAPSLSDRLAHALSIMLWNSQPLKPWSENRVNEPKKMVAEELPPLDPKWVRSRIPAVLQVFEDIFKSSVWEPEMEKSHISAAWISLSRALAFAASKEITPSSESMQTVAHVLGLLQRLWNEGPLSLNAVEATSKETFFERFRFISTTMIVALGSIPFTEKLLLKTANSTYQAATPTHRHSNAGNNPESPILHLLRLVAVVSGGTGPTPAYSRLLSDIIESACHGRLTRSSRLDILRQCATLYPNSDDFHLGFGKFAEIVWTSAAQLSVDCLCALPAEPVRERDESAARDYDDISIILSTGLVLVPDSPVWDRLMDTFIHLLNIERGGHIVTAKALEPFASLIMNLPVRKAYLPASSIIKHSLSMGLLSHSTHVENNNPDNISPSLPPGVIEMTCRVLSSSDTMTELSHHDGCAVFMESVVSLLKSGTTSFRSLILDKLQRALGPFVNNTTGRLVEGADESTMVTACHALSSTVLDILKILPHDASTLQRLEPIICSGLESSHMPTAERFESFIESSFETQQLLVCPANISRALQDLKARAASENSAHTTQLSQSKSEIQISQPTGVGVGSLEIAPQDESTKSRMDFILDVRTDASQPAVFKSTSAVVSESGVPASQETPKDLQQAPVQAAQNAHEEARTGKETAMRYKQMFSMIDNLRSSSPLTTTPRELGFMTPPHLRTLRNEESGSEPQTPTIPAVPVDNEDGFLGSSPTPAIRGRTSSAASLIPPSVSAVADSMELDPPSSPPEHESQNTDSRQSSPSKAPAKEKNAKNRKRNRSRRSKTPNKEKPAVQSQNKQHEPDEPEKADEVQANLSRRLRSADKSSATNDDSRDQESQETPKPKSMCNDPGHDLAANPISRHGNNRTDAEHTDMPVDEASEDTDTQATSQLEHDLVYAVDLGSDATDKQAVESMEKAVTTRKRKREGDSQASPSRKERRRSSRISSTPAAPAEDEQSQSTVNKKQNLADTAEEAQPTPIKPTVKENESSRPKKQKAPASQEPASSPANTAAKKRKLDTDETALETPKPEKTKKAKESEKPDTQDSQKRRSGRISGVPAPDIPEETPPPKKSPRPSSARKQNKKQRNRRGERRRSQSAGPSTKDSAVTEENSAENLESQVSTADESSAQYAELRNSAQQHESDLQSIQEESVREPGDVQMAEVQPAVPESAVADVEAGVEAQNSGQNPQPIETTPRDGNQPLSESAHQPNLPASEPASEKQPEREAEPAPQPNQDAQISISLRSLIDQVKLASLDRNAVKEMDELLFDFRVEMHEALRRHRDNAGSQSQ